MGFIRSLIELVIRSLIRLSLSSITSEEYDNKVWIGAWVDDLECTIDIIVHPDQVKDLAKEYEKSEEYVNLPFIWK